MSKVRDLVARRLQKIVTEREFYSKMFELLGERESPKLVANYFAKLKGIIDESAEVFDKEIERMFGQLSLDDKDNVFLLNFKGRAAWIQLNPDYKDVKGQRVNCSQLLIVLLNSRTDIRSFIVEAVQSKLTFELGLTGDFELGWVDQQGKLLQNEDVMEKVFEWLIPETI